MWRRHLRDDGERADLLNQIRLRITQSDGPADLCGRTKPAQGHANGNKGHVLRTVLISREMHAFGVAVPHMAQTQTDKPLPHF